MYCLLGSDKNQCRVMRKSNDQFALREYGLTLNEYAIYRNMWQGRNFHNATDERFLIEYYNSPYWNNRGDQKEKEYKNGNN